MSNEIKKEASTVAAIKGFSAPFGMVRRKRAGSKKNPSKPYNESAMFETAVIQSLLDDKDPKETVRKRGNQWVYYDDETGAQKGIYPDRVSAWDRQRKDRIAAAGRKKTKGSERKRQIQSLATTIAKKAKDKTKPQLAKKAKKAKKAKIEKPKKVKRIQANELKELFRSVLNESSMISYVFEQSPVSDESVIWDKFTSRLSRETVMSDPKLKSILQNMAKSEVKLLAKAIDVLKNILKATGSFDVERKGVEEDPETKDIKMNFLVKMKDNNKTLGFAVKLENGRPLLLFPQESRDAINAMANDESKLLRSELMHSQEVGLDHMDDVVKVTQKRDDYLKSMEQKLDSVLDSMGPLQVAMLKYILKTKYKDMR